MPKPALLCLALILLVWPKAASKARLCAALTAIGLGTWWFAASWGAGPATGTQAVPTSSIAKPAHDFTLMFWNLSRPRGIQQDMVDLVNQHQPHVSAFVEPGPNAQNLPAEYEALLPGYKVTFVPRGILWVSRIPSTLRRRGKLDEIGAFARYEVNHSGTEFPIVAADVYALPFRSREHQLQEVLGHAQSRKDAILAGDFNTPAESLFFDSFKSSGFQGALETAGAGFRETWPFGLPLLSLDHVWAGPDWKVINAQKIQRWSSDHAALLVTLQRR